MVKVLFCGDIEGHIKEVVEKVKKLNSSKLGPFDVLLCVGRFLNESNQIEIDSSISFPIPTYVVLKDDIVSPDLLTSLQSISNLHVINTVDYVMIQELRVLCIPGIFDSSRYLDETNTSSSYYRKSQIEAILSRSSEGPVDFVLAGEWALGILHFVERSQFPAVADCATFGSPIISNVLQAVCPRYFFCGSNNIFYERIPYRNSNQHITRIICLGPVRAGSDKSRKWLHALNVVPALQASEDQLIQCEGACSASPFGATKRDSTNSSLPEMKRAAMDSRQMDAQGRSNCWFCLAAPNVEKHLIVSIGEYSYLALPKGQLTSGHVLIVPIVHRQNMLQLPPEAVEEINRFKMSLVKMFQDQKKAVLVWERNLTTRNPAHCNIQLLPLEANKEGIVKLVLDAAATQRGFRFTDIPKELDLSEFAGEDDYLYAEVYGMEGSECKRFGYDVRERRPQMQFFHQAVGSLVENANAGDDWKSIQKSVEEEAASTDAFREMYKPYDFTIVKKDD